MAFPSSFFAGIVAGLPAAIGGTLDLVAQGAIGEAFALFLFLMAIAVTAIVIFAERAQRRITVNYARRQQGRKMYAAQSSHLPLKLNMSGVIPPIFASSIILFPATLLQWSSSSTGSFFLVAECGKCNFTWTAVIRYDVRAGNCVLLLLLYCDSFRFTGNSG